MGYTHYFEHKEVSQDTWDKIASACKIAMELSEVPIQYDYLRDDPPEINEDRILFNGVGSDGHETFCLNRMGSNGFTFCKTAQKPYDEVVTACLLIYRFLSGSTIDLSSDGDIEGPDWADGRALAISVAQYICDRKSPTLD